MEIISNFLSYVGWVLLAIMILVFVHELGHFLFAKLFKMRVERFSIGFPPKILGKKIGDTEYVIGLTPLGGYVKILGMVDESMDTDALESEPKPWEFRAKPVWQRIIVITGGVAFNFVLAALVFISLKAIYGESQIPAIGNIQVVDNSVAYDMGLRTGDRIVSINGKPIVQDEPLKSVQDVLLSNRFVVEVERSGETMKFEGPKDIMTQMNRSGGTLGVYFDPTVIGSVAPESAAEEAGLLPGDRIVQLDTTRIDYWSTLTGTIQASEGREMLVRWIRPDSLRDAIPDGALVVSDFSGDGIEYERLIAPKSTGSGYLLGISQIRSVRFYGLGSAVIGGIADTWTNTRMIAVSLARVFTGRENFRENVGGPIAIAKVTKEAADAGMSFFWNIVAMLSITLAIINILPIPALDGGHLVFLLYEGIVRREPSLKIRMVMQQIGMVLLLAFMAFVIFNDILKL